MWERDYSQKRAEGTEVLLTAKKRVDIVQSSEKLEQLKSFYRAIVGDERNTAVLKPAGK